MKVITSRGLLTLHVYSQENEVSLRVYLYGQNYEYGQIGYTLREFFAGTLQDKRLTKITEVSGTVLRGPPANPSPWSQRCCPESKNGTNILVLTEDLPRMSNSFSPWLSSGFCYCRKRTTGCNARSPLLSSCLSSVTAMAS